MGTSDSFIYAASNAELRISGWELANDGCMMTTTPMKTYFAFIVAAGFAVLDGWSLPEFCWSAWLAGVVYAWACIGSGCLQIIVLAHRDPDFHPTECPALRRFSPPLVFAIVVAGALLASMLAFRIYNIMFAFYGVFLSVFAAMEPASLFGENGFINSDFYTPVRHLLERFWPMVVGFLIAHWRVFTAHNPWKRLLFPLEHELVRLHFMVLALPFIALATWLAVGDAFERITIVFLMAVLYLMPDRSSADDGAAEG